MKLEDILAFVQDEHDWLVAYHRLDDDPRTPYAMLAKVMEEVGELSEALLAVQELQRKEKSADSTHAHLSEEFADVIFTTLILAKECDVDIADAMAKKIAKVHERRKK
jgi:NTP pyrophosphatase (non-canonical NTP hydrolase)